MPLEVVTSIAELNPAWPIGSDEKRFGDDHIRNVKTAVKSLLTAVEQLGFTTIEQTLNSATPTNITYTGVIQRGSQVVVFLQQDPAGGRLVTWDAAKFEFGPTDINIDPNGLTIVAFVGRLTGKLACYSVRMT